MMNDELDTLDALAAAATPGPWEMGTGKAYNVLTLTEVLAEGLESADAAFIATARDAVPALVATVRDRDAEVTRLREIEALTRQWFANGQQADATKLALIRALDGGGA